jgi:hypothetical protein
MLEPIDAEFTVITEARKPAPPAPKPWSFWRDDFPYLVTMLLQILVAGVGGRIVYRFVYHWLNG